MVHTTAYNSQVSMAYHKGLLLACILRQRGLGTALFHVVFLDPGLRRSPICICNTVAVIKKKKKASQMTKPDLKEAKGVILSQEISR